MPNSTPARLEHLNVTVANIHGTAAFLCDVFGWKIRWEGASIYDGYSMHIGSDDTYLALYTGADASPSENPTSTYTQRAALNHLGIVVPDLDATEARVKAHDIETYSHQDYEPGRRFYFKDANDIEFEVVQYD